MSEEVVARPEFPCVEIATNSFYNVDCIRGARACLAANSVDLIVTDPPYGINGHKLHQHYNRNEGFVVEGYIEVPQEAYNEFSRAWILEAERVLRPGGQIYIVSGYTNLFDVLDGLRRTRLQEINHLIWKYNFGVYTTAKYVSSHYHILYYAKPGAKRTFNLESRFGVSEEASEGGSSNYQDREDVWVINREYKPGRVKNKNELPTALLMKMIQYSSNEGDIVADFFLGGFSTARVAIGLGRRATGFEASPTIFESRAASLGAIVPGELLGDTRKPVIRAIENQGQPWTQNECLALRASYLRFRTQRVPKGKIIEALCKEFQRGKWSIVKALKRMNLDLTVDAEQMPIFS